jgi:ABC-2 type transport system ATP-binding protein
MKLEIIDREEQESGLLNLSEGMISVKDLSKRYVDTIAVDRVSFSVPKGEILGFLGPNGAGKSTTMRILSCFTPPTEGVAEVDGLDVTKHSLEVRRRVGYLPENVPLYTDMRVTEYLTYRARIKGVTRAKVHAHIDAVMGRCGVGDMRRRLIGQLSKGYRQRVGLADALLGSPKLLILDEPTVGLDPQQIRQVRDLMKELGSDHTVILSSHVLPEVENVCDRVLIINKGKIVAQDATENLRSRIKGSMKIFLEVKGSIPALQESLIQLEGILSCSIDRNEGFTQFILEVDRDIREGIFKLGVKSGWILRELRLERASLEDIFIHITTKEEGA